MRLRAALLIFGGCLLTSGCQLTWDTTQNLVFRACLFTDTMTSKAQYHHQANEAWGQYCSSHQDVSSSSSFGKGFRTGYAEYLEDGGDTAPPPLPPMQYWKIKYQNPEGRKATQAWTQGYQAGATAAKGSGARNYIVVPFTKNPPPVSPPPVLPTPSVPAFAPGAIVVPPAGSIMSPELHLPTPEKELPVPHPVPGDAESLPGTPKSSAAVNEPSVRQWPAGPVSSQEANLSGTTGGDVSPPPNPVNVSSGNDSQAAPVLPVPLLLSGKEYPKNP